MGCSYLTLPEIPVPVSKVLIYWRGYWAFIYQVTRRLITKYGAISNSKPECLGFEISRAYLSNYAVCFQAPQRELSIISFAHKLDTLRPRQNGRHFPDDIFKCIFLNENVWISIWISLKCVPEEPINNIPALVQIMAWRRPGDKPLSEPMMVNLLTHICVTRPQWVDKHSDWLVWLRVIVLGIVSIYV